MNERLEQEIKMILSKAVNEQFGDGRMTAIRDYFTRDEFVNLILAGYNLALEDVKKEADRCKESARGGYEDGGAEHGYKSAILDIEKFIDSQKQ